MVIDYKDITFSFKAKRRKKRLKRIRLIVIVLFVIISIIIVKNQIDLKKIQYIQELLLQDKINEAENAFKKIEKSIFHKKTKKELKALILLFNHKTSDAEKILEKIKNKTHIIFSKFLDYFSDKAEYLKLKIYTDYLISRGEDTFLYKAIYKTAFFNFKHTFKTISQISPENREKDKKTIKIINDLNAQLKSGKVNYILDIKGEPLAYYDIKKKKTVSVTPGFSFRDFNAHLKRGLIFYKLTIDLNIQKKIHQLFKDYSGSFILFNLNDSSIMAAYSKPYDKKTINAVFSQLYEPGSIIKVITLYSYLKNSTDNLFPFFCKGNLTLNAGKRKKVFYDWIKHNSVENYIKALAVSCNVSFAKMGIRTGLKKLKRTFNKFYFNSKGFSDQFFIFKTGSYNNTSNDFHLANLSVGLEEIKSTTFHSAIIAAIISQNGSIYSPYLIKNIKNVLNLGFYNHDPKILKAFEDNTTFLKVKEAMNEVVENSKGTGRRSRVDFIQTAIKTGSAGDRKKGLDAILLGFFPAKKPLYAFAFRLERAGRADIKGALFLKNFLVSFYNKK